MNGKKRGWMLGVLLVIAGVLICGAALAAVGFDFSKLGTGKYAVNTYEASGSFRRIAVLGDTEKIVFALSEDGGSRVVCREKEDEPHTVRVEDGTLTVENTARGKWRLMDFSFWTEGPAVTVYLPEKAYLALTVDAHTGDVEIPADFSFDSLQVTLSTGSVSCRAAAAGDAAIQTGTGRIWLSGLKAGAVRLRTGTGAIHAEDVVCEGDFEAHVSTGGAALERVACGSLVSTGSTGSLTLKDVIASGAFRLRRSTGSIRFDGCDAETIEAATSTGSVTGTLLTDKVFIARSATGRIEVPDTVTGGRCEITTSTGGIRIGVTQEAR